MSLFQWGNFTLHSGQESWWRIDCDSLSDSEIELFARLIYEKVGEFHSVSGPISHPGSSVPKLVKALKKYRIAFVGHGLIRLIVDDVLTTGSSLEEAKDNFKDKLIGTEHKGVVLFARGKCPDWVTPIFQFIS